VKRDLLYSCVMLGLLAALMILPSSSAWAGGQKATGNHPVQLVITKATADLDAQELTILGTEFGSDPTVFLGDEVDLFVELSVISSTDSSIVAELGAPDPGTYRLIVMSGPGATRISSMDVTLGAVGPEGPPGPPGPTGPAGSPGVLGFYRVYASFTCTGAGGGDCTMSEGDRPIATCDPGDVATGGSAYRDPTPVQPTFPLQDRISFPHPFGLASAPTGWTTALGDVPDQMVINVIAVCADLTP